jgi:ATP-dependent Clp protease adapter protein ClpS
MMMDRDPDVFAPTLTAAPFAGDSAAAEPAAPDTDVEVEEEEAKDTEEHLDEPWSVILYNDDVHTFEEVINQLVKATGCSTSEAEKLAWTVHTEGKATVYEGSFEECFEVQSVLKEIELVTEIKG